MSSSSTNIAGNAAAAAAIANMTAATAAAATNGSSVRNPIGDVDDMNANATNSNGAQTMNPMGFMFGSFRNSFVEAGSSRNGTISAPLHTMRLIPLIEKPPKFGGSDFKIWQHKIMSYITMLGLVNFLKEDEPPVPAENETNFAIRATYDNWCRGDYLCKIYLSGGLEDMLYNVYAVVRTSKEIWETLDKTYRSDDARIKKFVVAKFLNYKMVDNRPIMNQVQEFELILYEVESEGMTLPEAFIVAVVIEKLPPSWKYFKNYLKHKRKELTFEDLFVKLCIESDMRKRDLEYSGCPNTKNKGKRKVAAMKFEGDCYNCEKAGHIAKNCSKPKKKKAKQANPR